MAPVDSISADTNDGAPPAAIVETKATLTLPGGWCCGFAHRRAEEADGRTDVETVFVTRSGLRMTFRRESDPKPAPPSPPAQSFARVTAPSESRSIARGSRVDLLV